MKCLSCYWNVYENGGCCCVEPSNLCKPWQGNYWRYINKECVSQSSVEQQADNSAMVPCPKYHRGGKCRANPWRTLCGSEHCMVPAQHQ